MVVFLVMRLMEIYKKLWISVWSYYAVTLMPVLGIIQVGGQSMADRYTYLPSLGPLLIIGVMAANVYEKVSAFDRQRVMLRMAAFFIALAMLVPLSYAAIRQMSIWKNSVVLWSYVVEKEPEKVPLAYNNLGEAYESKRQLDKAIEQYQAALRLKPDLAEAHFNLGLIYLDNGSKDMAKREFELGLKSKPDNLRAQQILNSIISQSNR